MRILFSRRIYVFGAIVIAVLLLIGFGIQVWNDQNAPERESAQVETGDVSVSVSVSGNVRTKNTASLGFARSGIVSEVLVREGDMVKKGQVLATLGQSALISEYESALARLALAEARAAEEAVTTGIDETEAKNELARVEREQNEIVENALRALRSSDLAAVPEDTTNADTPPVVTGTYTCENEGVYALHVYRSNAESGYSYRIQGLETGSAPAYTGSAAPLGACGLFIQFVDDVAYGTQTWTIPIPNTKGASYITNLNAFELASDRRANLIEAAEEAVRSAKESKTGGTLLTDAARRAYAEVREAEVAVKAAEAKIADDTIRAPYDGVVTSVALSAGEVSGADRTITMTADDAYELKARIPEIDIAKIEVGDKAIASFDARSEESVIGTITFISPLPTEIDGVAYFEAYIALPTPPSWMRTGLNADVEVVIDERQDVAMLPSRFIKDGGGTMSVFVDESGTIVERSIEVGLRGNNGFVEVMGLPPGTVVYLP